MEAAEENIGEYCPATSLLIPHQNLIHILCLGLCRVAVVFQQSQFMQQAAHALCKTQGCCWLERCNY